jgi:hypothetical protein
MTLSCLTPNRVTSANNGVSCHSGCMPVAILQIPVERYTFIQTNGTRTAATAETPESVRGNPYDHSSNTKRLWQESFLSI